jgi:hypothetical protein
VKWRGPAYVLDFGYELLALIRSHAWGSAKLATRSFQDRRGKRLKKKKTNKDNNALDTISYILLCTGMNKTTKQMSLSDWTKLTNAEYHALRANMTTQIELACTVQRPDSPELFTAEHIYGSQE